MKKYEFKSLNETKFTNIDIKRDDIIRIMQKNLIKRNIEDVAVFPDTGVTNTYVASIDRVTNIISDNTSITLSNKDSDIEIEYRFVKGGNAYSNTIRIATSIGVYFTISLKNDVSY